MPKKVWHYSKSFLGNAYSSKLKSCKTLKPSQKECPIQCDILYYVEDVKFNEQTLDRTFSVFAVLQRDLCTLEIRSQRQDMIYDTGSLCGIDL